MSEEIQYDPIPYKWHHFPNYGYITSKLSDDILSPVWEEVKKIQKDFSKAIPENYNLVGNIEKEYALFDCKDLLEKKLGFLLDEYYRVFNYDKIYNITTDKLPIKLNRLWVNFQKKHEFNPIHKHSGVLSFVIWLDIPYDIRDEMEYYSSKKSNLPLAGQFQFQCINALGKISSFEIPVDKSYNGMICLFPSEMHHCVYPFYTSDEYRITVSGNFMLDSSGVKK